ncbi:MAG: helix-turn-helix transcriptional regulator [Betaproteobacteria bacterium]|nr:helix-turn-helix transcriptional regulator [Betaproteobacteria bacterium]
MSSNVDKQRGARIQTERKRLGLTQATLARKLGITRGTQVNYETGKRRPDGEYLRAFAEAGGDAGFVLFAEASTPRNLFGLGTHRVLNPIAKRFGINAEALYGLIDLVVEDEVLNYRTNRVASSMPRGTIVEYEHVEDLIDALLENGNLLEEIFSAVNDTLRALSKSLPPVKKAKLILSLYDVFKGPAHADKKIVAMTVKAALP